jgi:hypothetical protein
MPIGRDLTCNQVDAGLLVAPTVEASLVGIAIRLLTVVSIDAGRDARFIFDLGADARCHGRRNRPTFERHLTSGALTFTSVWVVTLTFGGGGELALAPPWPDEAARMRTRRFAGCADLGQRLPI